ncbi:hypothetical protein DNTS_009367 [Danionella cerebrum]|uniref:E3 ubiquitin-protein ligase RNF185 n=1 Tax=Danionella cerebrum TaxID=2873325 RepID=A0A553PX35_9TELE|nr:hypothetical protein DNTS_009367 [Danionella translucida]
MEAAEQQRSSSDGATARGAGVPGSGGGAGPGGGAEAERDRDRGTFECNICLDTARDAVISLCGHLFCWPCLHQNLKLLQGLELMLTLRVLQWLETRPSRQQCPVCKAGISRDKVIPLYGRGSTSQEDPRLKTPPRPQGQRTEPETRGGGGGGAFQPFGDTGFHMSFGIGAFPFGFFTTVFNTNNPFQRAEAHYAEQQPNENPNNGGNNNWQDSLFLLLAIFFFFWILSV